LHDWQFATNRKSIIALGYQNVVVSTHDFGICDYRGEASGLWSVDVLTQSSTLIAKTAMTQIPPAWQPLPERLTIDIVDAQEDPLRGLNVELRRADDTLLSDHPINSVGGTYVFDQPLAPGDYLVRATLIDHCSDPCTPAFDIRYAPGSDEPVWFEWLITLRATPLFTLHVKDDDPRTLTYNVPGDGAPRLDDMANIYFRVRQYVDWVKTRVTDVTGPTAHFYTFAVSDPVTHAPVASRIAYYNAAYSNIVLGVTESEYENRDGIADSAHDTAAPQNGEWHEFTHHLYQTWIHDTNCPGDGSHVGYSNPDSCDSLDEGFAVFLPTLAGQDILGDFSSSFYSSFWDLQWPTKAWSTGGDGRNLEELAIAALFWDVVARSGNTEATFVILADGRFSPVTYTNGQPTMPIAELWSQLTSAHPGTVADVRKSFGDPDLTIDLDGDGLFDVAPIDIPFLLHGFYPVDTDQTLTPSHTVTYYDVGYAQRQSGAARRDAARRLACAVGRMMIGASFSLALAGVAAAQQPGAAPGAGTVRDRVADGDPGARPGSAGLGSRTTRTSGRAAAHVGAEKGAIQSVAQPRRRCDGAGPLFNREAFAGQHSFADEEVSCLENHAVGGNQVPRRQEHQHPGRGQPAA
jgi:hypothetical protein